MKKEERLFTALSGVSDELLERSERRKTGAGRWIAWGAALAACLAVVLAGAVGNLIDRFALGFVTDMFRTLFIRFAVFNVADICVVAGGIALCLYACFFCDKLEPKPEVPHDAPDTDG